MADIDELTRQILELEREKNLVYTLGNTGQISAREAREKITTINEQISILKKMQEKIVKESPPPSKKLYVPGQTRPISGAQEIPERRRLAVDVIYYPREPSPNDEVNFRIGYINPNLEALDVSIKIDDKEEEIGITFEEGGVIDHKKGKLSEGIHEYQAFLKNPDSGQIIAQSPKKRLEVKFKVGLITHGYRAEVSGGYAPAGRDTAGSASALSLGGIRKRLGKDVGRVTQERMEKANPYLRNAVNAGKKMLDEAGATEYSRIFEGVGGLKWKYQQRLQKLEQDRKQYKQDLKTIRKHAMKYRREFGVPTFGVRPNDMINVAGRVLQSEDHAAELEKAGVIEELRQAFERAKKYNEDSENYYKDFDKDLMEYSARLQKYLQDKAKIFAIRLARQYRFPIVSLDNPPSQLSEGAQDTIDLYNELNGYAVELAENYVQRGRTVFFALSRQLGRIGGATETFQETYYNVVRSLWDLITGPWTIAWIFVVVQFYFMLSYIGYQPTILFTMPAAGGVMMFFMNFSLIKRPLDGVTHAGIGALLGQGIIIFMFALGITPNLWGWGWFAAIWFIFGLIGAFEFYPVGGPQIMFQTAVLVIVLGYIALGPYKGYWEVVKDQLRAPIYTLYVSAKNAVSDVWLLATNPTAWYAKQQVINVRPEQPISYPVELEVPVFEGLPPSAPAGTAFSTSVVVKNSGKLDVRDIKIEYACNEWCDDKSANPRPPVTRLTDKSLLPGESESFFINSFIAKTLKEREAEFRRARVFFNISYVYSTNSSLRVQVISDAELQRKFREREDVYKPVLAVDKATSVKFSLNVGPQPLVYKGEQQTPLGNLLVSISNRRPDGRIVMKQGSEIIIHFPTSIGSNLNCNGQTTQRTEQGKEVLVYRVPVDLEMKPYEFQTTFALVCTFKIEKVETQRTDFIIAELPDYTFKLEKILDVPITPPIGILFDPDEGQCKSRCGGGVLNACDENECKKANEDLMTLNKDNIPRCWFDPVGETPLFSWITPNRCRSCGASLESETACEVFYTEALCENSENKCGIKCKWIPADQMDPKPALGSRDQIQNGKCEKETPVIGPLAGSGAEKVIRAAKGLGLNEEGARWALRVAIHESGMNHFCTDSDRTRSDRDCTTYSGVKCGDLKDQQDRPLLSCGMFQINRKVHSTFYPKDPPNPWNTQGITPSVCKSGQTVVDEDCNILYGINLLKNNYGDGSKCFEWGCNGKTYCGWERSLRYYNGLGCGINDNYVENVKKISVDKYEALIAAIYAGGGSGDANYCEYRKIVAQSTNDWCKEGEGGCKSDEECKQDETIPATDANGNRIDLKLRCIDPGDTSGNPLGVKLCCYQDDPQDPQKSITSCRNKYAEKGGKI